MLIESVKQSSRTGQSATPPGMAFPGSGTGYASDHQDEQVDLHQASDSELAAACSQETLLALMQALLETLSPQPLSLTDPQHGGQSLYDDALAPSWLTHARHALTHPASQALRLTAIGQLTLPGATAQPFVLDMQLPHTALRPPCGEQMGQLVLDARAGASQGARVDYTLTRLTDFHAADRCNPPLSAEPPPTMCGSSGTPLFAQFSLGSDPEIRCMAARLLPAGPRHALPMHAHFWRDGSYVAMENPSGSPHQVDISA
ncbi:hypothetical protein [Paludibacterium sp. B53371]|uniref:hypothetical protein n=1 Tax=Paludibacterium sp. B53371 TaxID=2806263 RepID=UPI001C03E196|nr:hypothetical protein [Paludibacterium sp. B53371]